MPILVMKLGGTSVANIDRIQRAAKRVAVEVAKRGGRKAALDLSTADIPEPRPHTPPELAAEAGKKWPK